MCLMTENCGIPGRLGVQPRDWRALPDIEEGIWVSAGSTSDLRVDQDPLEDAKCHFPGAHGRRDGEVSIRRR